MSTADHAKNLAALLKRLKGKYEVKPPAVHSPLDELVMSVLAWEAPVSKAEHALKRLRDAFVDHNDLRVTRAGEVAGVIGRTYPRCEERAARLNAALNDIYKREHNVTLEPVMAMSKRDAGKYVLSLAGLPGYAAARWLLLVLQSHHIPVDDRLLERLLHAGVVEEGDDCDKAMGVLERHVKHEDALTTHLLLQAWSEDAAEPSAKPAKKPTIESVRKKAPTKPAKKTAGASR